MLGENSAKLSGSGARVTIAPFTTGAARHHIDGSPFEVLVAPEDTDPTMTIAYGRGLSAGMAGETSMFTIQAKDTWGNNRWDNQSQNVFRVDAYMPFAYTDRANHERSVASVHGKVNYIADGTYNCSFTPTISGEYVVAVTMAMQLEVQVITTSFSSDVGRSGTFTLSSILVAVRLR